MVSSRAGVSGMLTSPVIFLDHKPFPIASPGLSEPLPFLHSSAVALKKISSSEDKMVAALSERQEREKKEREAEDGSKEKEEADKKPEKVDLTVEQGESWDT